MKDIEDLIDELILINYNIVDVIVKEYNKVSNANKDNISQIIRSISYLLNKKQYKNMNIFSYFDHYLKSINNLIDILNKYSYNTDAKNDFKIIKKFITNICSNDFMIQQNEYKNNIHKILFIHKKNNL